MSTYATFLSRTGLSSGQFLGYAAVGSITTGMSLALALQEYRKVQPIVDKSPLALRERNHVRNALGYCTAGLAITTATAAALRGRVNIGFLGGMAATILPMIGTQMLSYEDQPIAKHALWATTCTGMGAMLSPMAFLPTTIIQGAFLGTAAIAAPTVFVGLQSATYEFNWMGAGLMLGLGVVTAATFGRMFLPHSNMLANLATYGGVGVFSLFLLYDANNLKARARQPRLDPINDSFNIYLDSINIFVRMAEIQAGRRR